MDNGLPEIPKPIIGNIPTEMKDVPNWVCFKAPIKTKADGTQKRDKVPINPSTGGNASSKNPGTWGTFQQAVDMMNRDNSIAGIGYQFRHKNDISALDFDDCFDDEGNLYPEVLEIINEFDSWTELSPSRRGVHIWVKGTIDQVKSMKYPHAFEKFGVEVFCSNFFMTVTGIPLTEGGSCGGLMDSRTKLRAFWKRLEGTREQDATKGDAPKGLRNFDEFNRDVIAKMRATGLQPCEAPTAISGHRGHSGWKWLVKCPWEEEHTGGNSQAAVYYYDDRTCGFNCFHNHCAHRTWHNIARKFDLPEPSYIDDFNAKHAVALIEGKAVILNEESDPVSGDSKVTFSSPGCFKTYYANHKRVLTVEGKDKVIKLGEAWLQHTDRRQYSTIMFDPSRKHETANAYNLFSGFTIKPSAGGPMEGWLQHVHERVCSGNDEYFRYLTHWMARIIQDPGSPLPGVSLVLQGEMGTGKGLVGRTLCKLTSPHSIHLTGQNQLTGNFNNHLKDVVTVFADEAFFAGDKQHLGRLKGLITEDRLFIEPKGVNGFMIQNHINVVMASNEDWVVPAGLGERRFFILNVDPMEDVKRTEYFAPIYADMNKGGLESLCAYLNDIHYDPEFLRSPPITEGLIDQKVRSLDSIGSFWNTCLDSCTVIRSGPDKCILEEEGEWMQEVPKKQLYFGYLRTCDQMGVRYPLTFPQFSKDFQTKIPGVESFRRQDGGVRKWFFKIPSFDQSEKLWKAEMKRSI